MIEEDKERQMAEMKAGFTSMLGMGSGAADPAASAPGAPGTPGGPAAPAAPAAAAAQPAQGQVAAK